MKIIIANKYLYPRGGDCLYTLRLMKLLSDAGHTVIPFTMNHPQNIKTDYDKYFVPHIDFREELKKSNIASAFRVASRAIVNNQAAGLLEKMIEDFQPDLIHLNNIHHQLTPAILRGPAKYNIPIVWTLHDYNLFCPDHLFLRGGQPCVKCAGGNFTHAVINRCKKGSLGASLIAALECSIFPPKKLAQQVARFICPSRFLANILVKYGIPENQVVNISHFTPPSDIEPAGFDYFIYIGRLSKEKGIETLLEAFRRLNRGKLIIVGNGSMRQELEEMARAKLLRGVEFVGQQPQQAIFRLLSHCLAAIVPSICWELFGLAVQEAMTAQKPVIASRMGGMVEQVDHGSTGFLFEAGDADQLAQYMSRLLDDRKLARKMGRNGRIKLRDIYGPETHYSQIIKVYDEVIDNKRNGYQKNKIANQRELTTCSSA